jgi:CBS domain-containing protein
MAARPGGVSSGHGLLAVRRRQGNDFAQPVPKRIINLVVCAARFEGGHMERLNYSPLPMAPMRAGVVVQPPAAGPKPVRLDSPAIEVMTDLRRIAAATIAADATIAQTNRTMIARGVRLLLVVDVTGTVLGLITAHDIVGEKPVNLLHETHGKHDELTVADLMVPASAIDVFDIDAIRRAEVGHVIATLKDAGRQHALVIDRDPLTREEFVRGIFSATQIGRQLGMPIATFEVAHTFAEIEAELAR